MQGETEDIEFLARSQTRVQLVKELRQEGELGRDELRSRLDASRTTVQRNVEALEDRGWVQNGNRTYSLASCGELIADDFLNLVDTVSVAEKLQPVLRRVDRSEFDFDLGVLTDAEVTTAEPGDPYAMINKHVETIRNAECGCALLPFTGLHATEAAYEQVIENGSQFELIAERDVARTHQSDPQYKELNKELAKTGRYEIFAYDGSIPFVLCIFDETVQIIASEGDEPQAMLESDAAPIRDWAEQFYEEYKAQATKII